MLLLKIRVRDEDRFNLLLQLLKNSIQHNWYKVEVVDIEQEGYLYFIIDYHHPKYINALLLKIKDISEVIQFPIEYAYIYSKEEAYTQVDKISGYPIPFNVLNGFGIC